MNTINLDQNKYERLLRLELPKEISNTEGKLFIYSKNRVVKEFYITEGSSFEDKIHTIKQLVTLKEELNIPSLVLPTSLVKIEGKLKGYCMEYIKGRNLEVILQDKNISNYEKITYLKEIGKVLETLKEKRNEHNIEFYINDLHSSNFIVENKTNDLKVIDLDSAKVSNNNPSHSKYLRKLKTKGLDKYEIDKNKRLVINENTDLYCYISTIFNFIYKDKLSYLTKEEYYDYLCYLRKEGITTELLEAMFSIYENKETINPYKYIDSLSDVIYVSDKESYKIRKTKYFTK